eukprot:4665635-Prymnesium_polylepis.1
MVRGNSHGTDVSHGVSGGARGPASRQRAWTAGFVASERDHHMVLPPPPPSPVSGAPTRAHIDSRPA